KMKIGHIIGEPLKVNTKMNNKEIKKSVNKLLNNVGLKESDYSKYPYQFSGGQRQRITIARVLSINPQLIVADEAVSALDVSIQSQVLNLMSDLKEEYGLSYIFISHDLSVIKNISDRIGVVYLGDLVEYSTSDKLYETP